MRPVEEAFHLKVRPNLPFMILNDAHQVIASVPVPTGTLLDLYEDVAKPTRSFRFQWEVRHDVRNLRWLVKVTSTGFEKVVTLSYGDFTA